MDYYFLILSPITLAITWIGIFIAGGRFRQLHDRLFLAFLICSTLVCYIVIRAIVGGTSDYMFIALDNLETLLGLSMCPLLFLYIRTVALDPHWHNWYIWLFVPAVVLSLTGTALSFMVGWDRILEIRTDSYAPFIPDPGSIVEHIYRIVGSLANFRV